MSDHKVITVLGATGTQGGAVARAPTADCGFTVRAASTARPLLMDRFSQE
jgi:uncharacterized protein YbjT (DUF2867 family)